VLRNKFGRVIRIIEERDIAAEPGEVRSTDPAAKQERLAKGLARMNGLSKLTWTIELPPATERRLNYLYEVYVRR